MSESTEATVAAAIRNAIGAHTKAQDAGRTDDVVALYTKDAVLELNGLEPIEGHDALREAFQGWAPSSPQLHLVGNIVVTPSSQEEATAVSDVAFFHRGESGWAMQVAGRYEDTFCLDGGAWKLRRRSATFQA